SSAMIPYSMAYTDASTEDLNALTGGDVSRAQAMGAQAIAQTAAQFGSNSTLTSDQTKVEAAMNELAKARECT
ncbi:tubuliform spidroin, partial [Bifidobacterium sp. MSK23_125]|nr:tubuliform spidroin [Bifidobacterium sp. MSK23_125]